MTRNVNILGTGVFVPSKKLYNDYFIEHFNKMGLQSEGLMRHLGRRKRYLATEDDTSLTMAHAAAKDVLSKLEMFSGELDMVVFVSDTPEYLMPTNAIKLVHLLQAENANMAFDLNSNCVGILTGLDVVVNYMKGNPKIKKALVVGSFLISTASKKDDTMVYPNLADAAAAIVLEGVDEEERRGFLDTDSSVDADYHETITLPKCGLSKVNSESVDEDDKKLQWNPFDFSFLSDKWCESISTVLKRQNVTPQDVDFYIFSQLSDADNEMTLDKLGVDPESGKYFFVGKEYGYTGNTCPILVLNRMWRTIANRGSKVVFCSVGAGYLIQVLYYQF